MQIERLISDGLMVDAYLYMLTLRTLNLNLRKLYALTLSIH